MPARRDTPPRRAVSTRGPRRPAKSAVKKPRSAYLDNARGMLIYLVVLGHVLAYPLGSVQPTRALLQVILLFHMPAFAFVTGWLTKPDVFTVKGAKSTVRLVAIYAVLVGLNWLWSRGMGSTIEYTKMLQYPPYATWWFVSLVSWRLLLPAFSLGRTRNAALISIALAATVALVSGYVIDDGAYLSLSRTCVFLPFFLAGFRGHQQGWHMPKGWWTGVVGAAVLVGAFLILLRTNPIGNNDMLYGLKTIAGLKLSPLMAGWVRVCLLASSAILITAFMTLVPRRVVPFTHLGATALSVYAWHPFIIRASREFGFAWFLGGTLVAAIVSSLLITVALGFGPLAKVTMRAFGGKGLKKAGSGPKQDERRAGRGRRARNAAVAPARRS